MIEGLENIKILDSWYWDRKELEIEIEGLQDQINEIRKKIRLLDKERKLQPPLEVQSVYLKEKYRVIHYCIIDLERGLMRSEQKQMIEGDRKNG